MQSKTSLSDSEINVLKFISKTHRDIHEGRIKRELHVVITTLSFYAACVAFKLNKGFSGWQTFFVCLAFIIVAICVYIYLKASGKSNNFNQGLSQVSENILLKSLEEPSTNNLSDLLKKLLEAYENPDKFIENHQKNKEGRPSANRWLWQEIIVISGAFISIVLIDYVIIGFFMYVIFMIYIIADYLRES